MKKTYMNPTTKIVKISITRMIAASLGGLNETGGTTTLTNEYASEGGAAMSRHGRSLWDDDEEY